jgi:hypothetical protein
VIPVPVHVVTGAPGAQFVGLIARLRAARADWAVLEPLACPCCVGRVELQVGLVRLLRVRRPARVLVRLVDPAHQAAFDRVLREWPLQQHVVPARAIHLPEDAALTPEALEAPA